MLLLFGVAVAIVIALLRGGNLGNLGNIRFRWAWVAVAALTIQVVLIRAVPDWTGPARLFFPLTHAAIFAVAWANRDYAGMWLVGIGAALNFTVMAANGGFMPTTPEALELAGLAGIPQSVTQHVRISGSKDIILLRDEITLWWLSDVIPIRPIQTIISFGDALIASGMFVFVQNALLQREDTGW